MAEGQRMPQMWKLILPQQSVLAVLVTKDSQKELLNLANILFQERKSLMKLEKSGTEGWTQRMRLARSCLTDEQADYHSWIVEDNWIAGFGLGPNHYSCKAAAYLAHMVSDPSAQSHPLLPGLKIAARAAHAF